MGIAVIDTGLYPDRESVEAALARLGETHRIRRIDVRGREGEDAVWDTVLDAVLEADRAVTL